MWALFDHDGRTDIDAACAQALRSQVTPILSHPAFELWLLLHFQDFSPAAQDGSNQVIIEKLRSASKEFASYGQSGKRLGIRQFAALSANDGIAAAVERARRLAVACEGHAPDKRDPSTDIFLVVEALGIVPAVT